MGFRWRCAAALVKAARARAAPATLRAKNRTRRRHHAHHTMAKNTKPAAAPAAVSHPLRDLVGAVSTTYRTYISTLTPRLQLIDLFLAFLVLLGVLQFVYVVLVGNFPFNAFLGGFIACVGQFVLTVSLRLQYLNQSRTPRAERAEDAPFDGLSPERALGDYVFASLILHFTVYHFIN
jgi:oligosaccharyltransferase complex subunit epsilon